MVRLLLETATDVCSVAIARGEVLLAEHTAAAVHQHASHLTLFIGAVLEEAGLAMTTLEEVVLSDGPGSYTSLRVGAATAKGLCVALPGLRLRVVPTLASLALATAATGPVLATINSRKGEVYGQLFEPGARTQVPGEGPREPRRAGEAFGKRGIARAHPLWLAPQNIRLRQEGWWEALAVAAGTGGFTVVGPGQDRLRAAPGLGEPTRFAPPESCAARYLLAPAAAPAWSRPADVAAYEPCYLNPPFVTKSKKKPLG